MIEERRSLTLLEGVFAICRLDKESPLPDWGLGGRFFSISRTPDELSVVCEQSSVPEGVDREAGWCCLKVESPFDFDLSGIIQSIAALLAGEGTTMFMVATRDSDYLLIKQPDLESTIALLKRAGHRVDR